MTLRAKTLLLIGLVLSFSTLALHQVISYQQLESYREIERDSSAKDLARVEAVIQANLQNSMVTAADWGNWDTSYDFAEEVDPEFIVSDLQPLTLIEMGVNVLLYLDLDGTLRYGVAVDLEEEEQVDLPEGLLEILTPDSALLSGTDGTGETGGFLQVGDSVMATAVSPVLRSDSSGPSRGYFVIGRYLDTERLADLEAQTQLSLALIGRDDDAFVGTTTQLLAGAEGGAPEVTDEGLPVPLRDLRTIDEMTQQGQLMFFDPTGAPIFVVSSTIPRTVYLAGKESLTVLLIALSIGGLLLIVTVLLLLDRLVLRRLAALEGDVKSITSTTDLGQRVTVSGHDEFSRLGETVNTMLEQLEQSRAALSREHQRAEGLLLNILPGSVAKKLKSSSDSIADQYDEVSILFADLVGFTELSSNMDAKQIVEMLNQIFSGFDDLATSLGIEKIKTIGDSYMVAAGLPEPDEDHAGKMAEMALGMLRIIEEVSANLDQKLSLRIGINSGVVVAGVIGKSKFIYDLWGDAVNIASRMESSGAPGRIQITEATHKFLGDRYTYENRGEIEIKGRGQMETYYLSAA